MNNCVFLGTLEKKSIELSKDGSPVLLFTIKIRDDEGRFDFVNAVAYSKSAELINRDFHKGFPILINAAVHSYKKGDEVLHNFKVRKFYYPNERSSA